MLLGQVLEKVLGWRVLEDEEGIRKRVAVAERLDLTEPRELGLSNISGGEYEGAMLMKNVIRAKISDHQQKRKLAQVKQATSREATCQKVYHWSWCQLVEALRAF